MPIQRLVPLQIQHWYQLSICIVFFFPLFPFPHQPSSIVTFYQILAGYEWQGFYFFLSYLFWFFGGGGEGRGVGRK
jgi:hypothetical protein